MCNFIDDIPTKSKFTSETVAIPQYLELYLRPTENSFYRFRLIGISTKNRDNPFIERYVHEYWGENAEGKWTLMDKIVCPRSKYVGEKSCPICDYTNKLYATCKNSGWTDKVSQRKRAKLLRQYRAHILVYVVNDPTYQANNGKIKVITFTEPEEFKTFFEKAKQCRRNGLKIFNNSNAVDFWVKVDNVEEVFNEGTPREFRKNKNKIIDMGFSTKPYSIDAIQPALIDKFPFDDEFYSISTNEEILNFYKKYCTGIGVDVPQDDIIPAVNEKISTIKNVEKHDKATEIKKNVKQTIQQKQDDIVVAKSTDIDLDIDDLVESDNNSSDNIDNSSTEDKENSIDDIKVEEIDTLNIDDLINF